MPRSTIHLQLDGKSIPVIPAHELWAGPCWLDAEVPQSSSILMGSMIGYIDTPHFLRYFAWPEMNVEKPYSWFPVVIAKHRDSRKLERHLPIVIDPL